MQGYSICLYMSIYIYVYVYIYIYICVHATWCARRMAAALRYLYICTYIYKNICICESLSYTNLQWPHRAPQHRIIRLGRHSTASSGSGATATQHQARAPQHRSIRLRHHRPQHQARAPRTAASGSGNAARIASGGQAMACSSPMASTAAAPG